MPISAQSCSSGPRARPRDRPRSPQRPGAGGAATGAGVSKGGPGAGGSPPAPASARGPGPAPGLRLRPGAHRHSPPPQLPPPRGRRAGEGGGGSAAVPFVCYPPRDESSWGGTRTRVRVVALGEAPPPNRPEFWLLGADGEPYPLNPGFAVEVSASPAAALPHAGGERAPTEGSAPASEAHVEGLAPERGEWEHAVLLSVGVGEDGGPLFRAEVRAGTGFKRRSRRTGGGGTAGTDFEAVWQWAQEQDAELHASCPRSSEKGAPSEGNFPVGGLSDVSAVEGLGLTVPAVQVALRNAAAQAAPGAAGRPAFIRLSELLLTESVPPLGAPALIDLREGRRKRTRPVGASSGLGSEEDLEVREATASEPEPQPAARLPKSSRDFPVEGPPGASLDERQRAKVARCGQLYLHHVAGGGRTGATLRVDASGRLVSVADVAEIEMQPVRASAEEAHGAQGPAARGTGNAPRLVWHPDPAAKGRTGNAPPAPSR